MLPPPPPELLPTEAAVLVVLLPPVVVGMPKLAPATTQAQLDSLQRRLGAVVQVLVVEEDSHPAVVRSFRAAELPAFILVRQGIELWRQSGLPEGECIVQQLLNKLQS